ncbi:MAG: substrate-binding domain-containing protein [Flavobacteriaceae bacterium]|nr:substrate-binding domain-containing protein [Flavobacteriaceae bacterium]
MKTFLNYSILIALFISINACKSDGTNKGEDKLQGTVKIDGSSTVYPITEAVAEEFKNEFPDVQVTIGVSGTGGGSKNSVEEKPIYRMLREPSKTKKQQTVKPIISNLLDCKWLMTEWQS